jgi:hypothetical protein
LNDGVDAHGRIANHPEEFRATADELEYFDAGLGLGFLRRLEVILEECPIDIYAASSLKSPWPHRLQNAAECYGASFWRSQNRLLDSAIESPELSNREVLEKAQEKHATAVVAKDYLPFDAYDEDELEEDQLEALDELRREYTDNVEATTDSIREFARLYDSERDPPAYLPLQPPYAEHVQEVAPIVEESDLEPRYMLGGLARADAERRIDELLAVRQEGGEEPVAHGLGWGLSDELVACIRDEPGLLDSVDNSSPSQAVQNGKILDKRWQSRKCPNVDGLYQNTVHGAFEFAILVQGAHRLTEYNSDDLDTVDDGPTNRTLGEFGGVQADD